MELFSLQTERKNQFLHYKKPKPTTKTSFQVILKAWPNGFTRRHMLLATALCSLEDGCLVYPVASTVTASPQTVLHSHGWQPLQPSHEAARNLSGTSYTNLQRK